MAANKEKSQIGSITGMYDAHKPLEVSQIIVYECLHVYRGNPHESYTHTCTCNGEIPVEVIQVLYVYRGNPHGGLCSTSSVLLLVTHHIKLVDH